MGEMELRSGRDSAGGSIECESAALFDENML